MEKIDRIFVLHKILSNRRTPVSIERLCDRLECSDSTARRTLRFLRDRLSAPLEYDQALNGWYYDRHQNDSFELPGFWFSPEELYALLVSHHLLTTLQPGLLAEHIAPIKARIERLLEQQNIQRPAIHERIRILQMAARPSDIQNFRKLASSLLRGEQVKVLYHGRERDKTTERIISPQRLVYYRSNWYLDAWCHMKNGLRTFALDRMHPVIEMGKKAKRLSQKELDQQLASSYGIFSGQPKHTAVLHFSPSAARWVADEQWHPQQSGEVLSDGSYELRIPYNDPRELMMDILKYGPDVVVKSPKSLQNAVTKRLKNAAEQYRQGGQVLNWAIMGNEAAGKTGK
ncbi:MAG: YafY family protein [Pseudomonadota bacterium]